MTESITINGRSFPVVSSTPAKSLVTAKAAAHRIIPKSLDGEPVTSGTLTLSMAPPSVNALFFNRRGGGGKSPGRGKTLAYRNWRAFADQELRDQPSWHVPGRVAITVRVGGSRADADNMLKAALDALVNAGRIEGDSPKYVTEARAIHDASVVGTLIDVRIVK